MINKLKLLKVADGCLGRCISLLCRLGILPKPQKIEAVKTDQAGIKIAVIKSSAMGDALCLMPTLRLIKHTYPNSHLIWLTTTRSNPKLFESLPFIDAIQCYPVNHRLGVFLWRWRRQQIDLCIDCDQYYQISTLFALLARVSVGFLTAAKPKRLSKQLAYDRLANEKKQFLRLAGLALELDENAFDSGLAELLPERPTQQGQDLLKPILASPNCNIAESPSSCIVLYPGSSSNGDFRRWSLQRFLDLALRLCEDGYRVIIAGGPDELDLNQSVNEFIQQQNLSRQLFNLINRMVLSDWLWLLAHRTRLFIGNDAGLLHIAEACKIPVLGIFGPNIASKWGSLQATSRHIEISPSQLSCRPCIRTDKGQIPETCWRGDVACLNRISVTDVYKQAQQMLQ